MQNLNKPIIIKAFEMEVYTLFQSKILHQKKKKNTPKKKYAIL